VKIAEKPLLWQEKAAQDQMRRAESGVNGKSNEVPVTNGVNGVNGGH
jgi:hypothetical protein